MRGKQAQLDAKLRLLGNSGALDQYTALVNEIADLNSEIQKLREYTEIELQYSNREAALEGDLSHEVIKTNVYLEETRAARDQTFAIFKGFVDQFYPGVEAGISLRNNELITRSDSIWTSVWQTTVLMASTKSESSATT